MCCTSLRTVRQRTPPPAWSNSALQTASSRDAAGAVSVCSCCLLPSAAAPRLVRQPMAAAAHVIGTLKHAHLTCHRAYLACLVTPAADDAMMGDEDSPSATLLDALAASTAARGVCFANAHPAPRRWLPLKAPSVFAAARGAAANQRAGWPQSCCPLRAPSRRAAPTQRHCSACSRRAGRGSGAASCTIRGPGAATAAAMSVGQVKGAWLTARW